MAVTRAREVLELSCTVFRGTAANRTGVARYAVASPDRPDEVEGRFFVRLVGRRNNGAPQSARTAARAAATAGTANADSAPQ